MDLKHNRCILLYLGLLVFCIVITHGVEVRLDNSDGCISQECQVSFYLFILTSMLLLALKFD